MIWLLWAFQCVPANNGVCPSFAGSFGLACRLSKTSTISDAPDLKRRKWQLLAIQSKKKLFE